MGELQKLVDSVRWHHDQEFEINEQVLKKDPPEILWTLIGYGCKAVDLYMEVTTPFLAKMKLPDNTRNRLRLFFDVLLTKPRLGWTLYWLWARVLVLFDAATKEIQRRWDEKKCFQAGSLIRYIGKGEEGFKELWDNFTYTLAGTLRVPHEEVKDVIAEKLTKRCMELREQCQTRDDDQIILELIDGSIVTKMWKRLRNTVITAVRKERRWEDRTVELSQLETSPSPNQSDFGRNPDRLNLKIDLERLLLKLTPQEREVLERCRAGDTWEEISRGLGATIKKVRGIREKIKKKMRPLRE